MNRIIIMGAALVLSACATQTEETPPKASAAPVVVDSFCETAKKRQWSVQDTPDTIREALAWNRAIDKRCSEAKKNS